MTTPNTKYRCIGKGFCGSVWTLEEDEDGSVIKREDGGPGRSVTNDYTMHLRVLQSHTQHPSPMPLSIPQCYALIQPTNQAWWQQRLPRFPSGLPACRALLSERIPRVPRHISDEIVDLFCTGNAPLATFVKSNRDDDACLIRPYLGRRRKREATNTSRLQRFTLRNVSLHVDQMESLNLDVKTYAEAMADALAMMHWGAEVDANDVEFVLAPPRAASLAVTSFQSVYLGEHTMWILDFDCCRHMSMDESGIEQACAAFFRNDPYYPRPCGTDPADRSLWSLFKKRFLATSDRILGAGSPHTSLPETFILRLEEESVARGEKKAQIARSESALG